jgi:hypothetical protein
MRTDTITPCSSPASCPLCSGRAPSAETQQLQPEVTIPYGQTFDLGINPTSCTNRPVAPIEWGLQHEADYFQRHRTRAPQQSRNSSKKVGHRFVDAGVDPRHVDGLQQCMPGLGAVIFEATLVARHQRHGARAADTGIKWTLGPKSCK